MNQYDWSYADSRRLDRIARIKLVIRDMCCIAAAALALYLMWRPM